MREVPCGEKYVGPESGNIVVIEVLSVFLSRFSIPCSATFCSPLWNFYHIWLLHLFTHFLQPQARVEVQSQDRCASLLCFCYVSLEKFHCQADRFLLSTSSLSAFRAEVGNPPVVSDRSVRCVVSPFSHVQLLSLEPAQFYIQGPLFHPKWSAQYPPPVIPCGTPCFVSSSQTCARAEYHVCPAFVGHVL